MKPIKLFTILLLWFIALGLQSCNSNPKEVWYFSLGQSETEVKQILDKHKIEYINEDSSIKVESSIDYLGIKWNAISFDFQNDSLSSIAFSMFKGDKLTREQKKNVVESLDKIYGTHTLDESAKSEYGTVAWKWEDNEVNVIFTSLFKSKWASLLFHLSSNSNRKENSNGGDVKFDPNKIWIFTMGQPIQESLDAIVSNGLSYKETEYLYRIDAPIDFFNCSWHTVRIGKDDTLESIHFDNDGTQMLSYSEREYLISELDKIYGSHETDNTVAGGDYTWYYWYKDKIKITYAPMEQIGETLEFMPSSR